MTGRHAAPTTLASASYIMHEFIAFGSGKHMVSRQTVGRHAAPARRYPVDAGYLAHAAPTPHVETTGHLSGRVYQLQDRLPVRGIDRYVELEDGTGAWIIAGEGTFRGTTTRYHRPVLVGADKLPGTMTVLVDTGTAFVRMAT